MAHLPVMLKEVLEQLMIRPDGFYLDCTFGRGGHSAGILEQLGPQGHLLALDRDADAVNCDEARALSSDARFQLLRYRFSELTTAVSHSGRTELLDGILMDLGVSSPQLDTASRGFSFQKDGPLDMRMDKQDGLSAAQWLSSVSEQQLIDVLFDFGEERFARRIAKAIVMEREVTPITSTTQLAKLIENNIPKKEQHKHPATRTFQAIRIQINQEFEELTAALRQAVPLLKPGGRLVVISFHSLEDRIVKRFINQEAGAKFDPGRLPVKEVDIAKGELKKVGKPIKANITELQHNARARSAVLRVAEKLA